MTRAWLIVVLVLALPASANAHDRSLSYSRVSLADDGATIRIRLRALDMNALEAEGVRGPFLAPHLARTVALETASAPCSAVPGSFAPLAAPTGWSRFEWRVRCEGPPDTLRAAPIPSRSAHVAHVRVEWVESGRSSEHVLSELSSVASLTPPSADDSTPAFLRWVPIGVEHILTGVDHLLFLAMLLLLAGSMRETAVMVTGFTLGHSVTLAAVALGAVEVAAAPVEAIIGLSVALVAVENVWLTSKARDRATPIVACLLPVGVALVTGEPAFAAIALFAACHFGLIAKSDRAGAWRWGVACVFGLLHGFGFAGALLEGGLPEDSAIGALLGFNVGVELGQLAVVLVAWPLLARIARDEAARVRTIQVGSAAGVLAGVFWFVTRAFA